MGLQELDSSGLETQRHVGALFRTALTDLCTDCGFAALTSEDVCRRAGLSRSVFRSFYASVEECFLDACAAELRRLRRIAGEAGAGVADWRTRLRATAYALYRSLSDDERLRRLVMVEARAVGETSALLVHEALEPLYDLVDEGRAEPAAPATLTRGTAEFLVGGVFNEVYLASLHRGPLPPEHEMVPKMMYLTVLPYVGATAAGEELSKDPRRAFSGPSGP
jgi:AcrR family transcriptional regulator